MQFAAQRLARMWQTQSKQSGAGRRMLKYLVGATFIAVVGCRCVGKPKLHAEPAVQSPTAAPVAALTSPATAGWANTTRVQLIDLLPKCEVDQLGPVIEVGTPSAEARREFGTALEHQTIDRSGDAFARVYESRLTHNLWLDEPMERPRVTIRLVGAAATRLTVRVDKTVVGTIKLTRGELITRSVGPIEGIVEPGRHTVVLEFRGKPADRNDPSAEINWIHLGQPMDGDTVPTVPTQRTLVADQNIGGIPKRSIVLRAPSLVRCPVLLTGPAHLQASVGFWGSGHGLGEIRLLEDGQAPVILKQQKAQGGNGASWTPIDLDLSPYANRVVWLEFRGLRASQQGRVVFGEPKVVRAQEPIADASHTKLVLVVVASGLARRKLPPWGPIGNLAPLDHLLRDAVVFQNYQASSTAVGSVMASLITGMNPASHGLQDSTSKLSATLNSLQQSIKQSSGRTAMFTGVPSTFEPFGFNSNWDEYQAVSPVKDLPASEPLTLATRWLQHELELDETIRHFVLVHIRGMHPPWDLTKEEVAALQPAEYGGPIDARRGGITLARIRHQTRKNQRRLSDEDWVRLESLMMGGFSDQAQAFDQLINVLKRHNLWQTSLVIFMGDVGAGDPPNVPFEPVGNLRGDQLTVPLIVKFPGNAFAGRSVDRPVTTVDVTKTVYSALNLDAPEQVVADELGHIVAGGASLLARPLLATLGNRYASRFANWLMVGELGKEPTLCELYVDPACTANHFADRTLTAKAGWLWSRDEFLRMNSVGVTKNREAATIDPDTNAALIVWGDLEQ